MRTFNDGHGQQNDKGLPTTFLPFVLYVLKPYKTQAMIILFFAIVSGCYGTINSYLTKVIIDYLVDNSDKAATTASALWPAIFFIINFEVHSLSWRTLNYINMKIEPLIKNDIINLMLSYVHRHSFRFFQDNFSGTISNNMIILANDVSLVVNHISMTLLRGIVQFLLALFSMYFVDPIFMIALLIWTVGFVISSLVYANKIKNLSKECAESESLVSGKLVDSISNSYNIRIFAQKHYELKFLQKYLNIMKDKFRNKEWFLIKFYLAQGLSITLLIAVVLFYLIKLRAENLITIGDFAFILGLVLYVTENIWFLTEQIDHMNDAIGQSNQSLSKLLIDNEIKDKPGAQQLVAMQGEIKFESVGFHYKGTAGLFKDLSITIPAGQKVGLVGFSGSGKSTFVSLILRLYEVTLGRIRIAGQDIRDVTQDSLRAAIGLIPQEPTLFHRSLMDNIRYGRPEATDEEVIAAAKKAYAHEFIEIQPESYQTLAGERGVKLSGGQRQRIAIARAILKNAPILILDEATSQLDSITEGHIQAAVEELMQGKTTLVIAHRLSTLLHMERILVFDKGKIVADGTHEELILSSPLYKNLWEEQVGGFLVDKKEEDDS